jgi:primosomal protein N'
MSDCPDCDRPLDTTRGARGETFCYNCNQPYQLGQCDGCGDRVIEQEATTESVPGATLWWCPDCRVTNRERGRWA